MSRKTPRETEHSVLSNMFYMLKMMFRISPMLVIGQIVMYTLTNLLAQLVSVLGIKYVIDRVAAGESFSAMLPTVPVYVASMIFAEALNDLFFEFFAHREREKLYLGIHSKLYKKAAELDLESYDNPSFYSGFILAVETSSENISFILLGVVGLVQTIVSVVTVSSIIFTIDPWCTVIILASALAFVPLGRYTANLMVERRVGENEIYRRMTYFERIFYLPEYASEIRSNGIFSLLLRSFLMSADDDKAYHRKTQPKISALVFAQAAGTEIIGLMLILTAYLGYRVLVTHSITAGGFVASFNGAAIIGESVIYILIFCVRNFTERSKIIEKYRVFLAAEPKITDGGHEAPCEEPETISIECVSFSYAGGTKDALDDVSLEIKPYEKIALVGYNGAGKTTLTNLLLRLYDVQSGSVKIGGRDIREETVSSHRSRFAAVFQDFQLFGASVGENVAMTVDFDEQKVLAALEKAGFDKELPNGANTILLREFSQYGLMLSGGEAQKIAIARVFYKECPYVILDEPSANLDPISEYELNHAIMTKSDKKTVIVISHRLSTARSADRIVMMDNGRIIEADSHEELMALGGKYAEMFTMQSEKYKAKIQ